MTGSIARTASGGKNVAGTVVLRVQVVAVIVSLVSCLSLYDVRAAENGKADVVLRHGKIYTADPARSFQQSIAFTGNSIVAVGDDQDVEPLIGTGTKVIDLGGKLVLPGLIDTHTHTSDRRRDQRHEVQSRRCRSAAHARSAKARD